jgi:hypothetical protein
MAASFPCKDALPIVSTSFKVAPNHSNRSSLFNRFRSRPLLGTSTMGEQA